MQSFAPEIGFEIDAQYRMSFVRGRSALNDPLPVKGRWLLTVIVTAVQTQDINNLAVVRSLDLDPDLTNNEAYVQHTITDVSDLNVSKCTWWAEKNKWACNHEAVPVIAGGTITVPAARTRASVASATATSAAKRTVSVLASA